MSVNIPVANALSLDNNDIIHNDVVLPCQYHGERHPPETPEIRLVTAILVDAINCLFGKNNYRRGQANDWFRSRLVGPFTYWDCCQWLNIDCDALWERLQTLVVQGKQIKRVRGHIVEMKKVTPVTWR